MAEYPRVCCDVVFCLKAIMLISLGTWGTSLRARWRWNRGRCPLCNRNLHASIAYFKALYPNCFCRGFTQADSQLWNKYQDSLQENALEQGIVIQQEIAAIAAMNSKDRRAEEVRWEGEGGRTGAVMKK